MLESPPLVTVVTPVYNGEAFLAQCIESVLSQTYGNLEYVILDNASTDSTQDIVERYACTDDRIRVVRNNELLPQIDNWNESMRQITAESVYCKVVHADDILFPECIERMVALAERFPSISVVGAYRVDGQRIGMQGIPYPTELVPGRELCRDRLLGRMEDVFGSPTSVLYRMSSVRQVSGDLYNPRNPHADTEACFELLRHGDYGFVHQILTFTRRHEAAETPEMRRRGTHSVGRIMIARDYGRHFLNETERRYAMNLQLRYHYGFLAGKLSRLAEPKFRRETAALFATCGARLRFSKLALSVCQRWMKRQAGRVGSLLSRI